MTAWIFLALCAAALLARLAGGDLLLYRFFNADTLYLTSLYNEIFVDGGSWRQVVQNAAPFYFPDMPVYFTLYALLGRFEAAGLAYGLLQVVLFALAFQALLGELGGRRRDPSVPFALGLALLALASGHFDFLVYALLPNFHASALLWSLVGFVLLRRVERGAGRGAAGLLLLGTLLLSASDRFTLACFVAPACAYLLLFGRGAARLRWIAALVGAAALGLGLFYAEILLLHDELPRAMRRVEVQASLAGVGRLLADEPGLALAAGLSLLFHSGLGLFGRRLPPGVAGYVLLSSASVLGSTLWVANRGDLLVHQRYFLVIWLFGALGWAPLLRGLGVSFGSARVRRVAETLACALPLLAIGHFGSSPRGSEVDGLRFYPGIVRCIDAVAARRGGPPPTALADYWIARLARFSSRQPVHWVEVGADLGPYRLGAGDSARRVAEQRGGYDLLVPWRLGLWEPRDGVAPPDRVEACRKVPDPKEGESLLGSVRIWEYQRPRPLPWRRSAGRLDPRSSTR